MKELWDDMGYKNLQLKSQNLRDQASRLEKIRNNGTDLSIRERSVEDLGNITSTSEYSSQENIENESQNNQNRESGNANSPTRGLNLHSAEPQQIPEESRVTMGDWPDVSDDVPECLHNRALFTWSRGARSSGVGFFCFVSLRAWKQKKPTPLDRGPQLHVNRLLDDCQLASIG